MKKSVPAKALSILSSSGYPPSFSSVKRAEKAAGVNIVVVLDDGGIVHGEYRASRSTSVVRREGKSYVEGGHNPSPAAREGSDQNVVLFSYPPHFCLAMGGYPRYVDSGREFVERVSDKVWDAISAKRGSSRMRITMISSASLGYTSHRGVCSDKTLEVKLGKLKDLSYLGEFMSKIFSKKGKTVSVTPLHIYDPDAEFGREILSKDAAEKPESAVFSSFESMKDWYDGCKRHGREMRGISLSDPLFRDKLDGALSDTDVLYVVGGETHWLKHVMDRAGLREAIARHPEVVLVGHSAGAIYSGKSVLPILAKPFNRSYDYMYASYDDIWPSGCFGGGKGGKKKCDVSGMRFAPSIFPHYSDIWFDHAMHIIDTIGPDSEPVVLLSDSQVFASGPMFGPGDVRVPSHRMQVRPGEARANYESAVRDEVRINSYIKSLSPRNKKIKGWATLSLTDIMKFEESTSRWNDFVTGYK